MSDDGIHFPFREHGLDNGLRVVLHRDASAPVVAVHVMYHVGSKDERPGRTGFAHLFEHLLFQGSEHLEKGEHFRHVQNAGGTLNGSTWFDRTNYYETLPSNQLELALWLESDRMGFFAPAITQDKLDNQREVVKNERRQSYENRPYGLAFETALAEAYPEGHPYRHPTIGYMEDLDAASLEDVHDFFATYYGPNNATLVVAGDVEPDDALRKVERWFGDIEPGPEPSRRDVPRVGDAGERRAVLEDNVQVPRVYLVYHSPAYADPRYEASDVLSGILADGKSSRLHTELVYRRRLAGSVKAFTWPTESVGMFWVVATARPGVDADRLERAVREVIDELRDEGPDGEELDGARNRARRALIGQLNNVGDRADAFAHAAVLRDDPDYVNRALGRYGAVELEGVAGLAGEVLRPERLTAVQVVPDGDGADGPGREAS